MAYLDWSHSGPKRTSKVRNDPPDTMLTAEEAELIREKLNSLKLEVDGNAALLVAEALISAITDALSNEGWKSPIGPYPTKTALQEAMPIGSEGMLAIVGSSPNWGAYVWSEETDEWEVLNDSFEGMLKSEYATGNRPGEVDTANALFLRDANNPDPNTSITGIVSADANRVTASSKAWSFNSGGNISFEIASYAWLILREYAHDLYTGTNRLVLGQVDDSAQPFPTELAGKMVAALQSGTGEGAPGIRIVQDEYTELVGAIRLLAATAAEVATPADVQDGDRLAVIDGTTGEVVPKLATNLSGASTLDELGDVDVSTNAPNLGDILYWDGTNWVPLGVADAIATLANDAGSYVVSVDNEVAGLVPTGTGQLEPTAADLTLLANDANWNENGSLLAAQVGNLDMQVNQGAWYVHLAEGWMYFAQSSAVLVRMLIGGSSGSTPTPTPFSLAGVTSLLWAIDSSERTGWTLSGSAIQNMVGVLGNNFPAQNIYNAAVGTAGGNAGFNDLAGISVSVSDQFQRHLIQADTFDPFPATAGTESAANLTDSSGDFTAFFKLSDLGTLANEVYVLGTNTGISISFGSGGVIVRNSGTVIGTIGFPTALNSDDHHAIIIKRESGVISAEKAKDTAGDGVFTWELGSSTVTSSAVVQHNTLRFNAGSVFSIAAFSEAAIASTELNQLKNFLTE